MAKESNHRNILSYIRSVYLIFTMWMLPSLLRTGGLISFDCKRAVIFALRINTINSNNKIEKLYAFSTKKRTTSRDSYRDRDRDRPARSQQKAIPQQSQQQIKIPAIFQDSFSSGITASVLLVRGI